MPCRRTSTSTSACRRSRSATATTAGRTNTRDAWRTSWTASRSTGSCSTVSPETFPGPGPCATWLRPRPRRPVYMADRGAEVVGLDLSPGMIAEARRRNPAIGYLAGDMRRLPRCGRRVGWDRGLLRHRAIWRPRTCRARSASSTARCDPAASWCWRSTSATMSSTTTNGESGRSSDFVLHPTARVVTSLQAAGFGDVSATERDPHPDVEYPSRRAYVEAVRA
jgi:hypothetical protein